MIHDHPSEGSSKVQNCAESREALAKKLDDDLDEFIESLAKNAKVERSSDSFNFDEWCKEIDRHPLFMSELEADKDGEYSEAVQALQALKYNDITENKREEAEHCKVEGNQHFKLKKYRCALECYTNGIKQQCDDAVLNSTLYANRAAAHKYLGNNRSAFRDCLTARKFNPSNIKAIERGAECLLKLGLGQECLRWLGTCEIIEEKKMKRIEEMRKNAKIISKIQERDRRKQRITSIQDDLSKRKLLSAFAERKIKLNPPVAFNEPESFEWSQIQVDLPWLQTSQRVYLDDKGSLNWPILIQCPEISKADLIVDCNEESTLIDLVECVINESSNNDKGINYRKENVKFFVPIVNDDMLIIELCPSATIREILSIDGFVINHGLPVIQVYTIGHLEGNMCKESENLYRMK